MNTLIKASGILLLVLAACFGVVAVIGFVTLLSDIVWSGACQLWHGSGGGTYESCHFLTYEQGFSLIGVAFGSCILGILFGAISTFILTRKSVGFC